MRKRLFPQPKQPTRKLSAPVWLSSEFWLTLLTHAGLAAAAISGLLPGKYAAIAGAASQAAYSLSRGLVKASSAASSV